MTEALRVVSAVEARDGSVTGELTWEAGGAALTVLAELRPSGGLRSLTVRTEPGVVTARQLRELPVGAVERLVRAAVAPGETVRAYRTPTLSPLSDATARQDLRRVWRAWASDFVLRPRTGAGGRSDRPYAALAALYADAFATGTARPVTAVATELGFAESAVRNYLTKARDRGLLTSAVPGRPGGALTARGREVLGLDR